MQPTLIIALLSALFVATHIGMATARIRAWMVNPLSENRNLKVKTASPIAKPNAHLIRRSRFAILLVDAGG